MNQSIICPDATRAREILEMRYSPSEWIAAAIDLLAGEDGVRVREEVGRNAGRDWIEDHPEYRVQQSARRRHALEKVVNRAFTAAECVRWERAFCEGWNRVRG